MQDYMEVMGIGRLYPRAAVYLRSPDTPAQHDVSTVMDGYFPSIAQLHQLISLCKQLQQDMDVLNNHKYVAHQLAVLFVRFSVAFIC